MEPKFFVTSAYTEEPTDPTKLGYNFVGWYNGETPYTFGSVLTGNITLTAKWTESSNVQYTVIHWQENANDTGYSYKESETKTGTTGNKTNAMAKSYTGFTDQAITQETIAGDGSTIVSVYYKRNVYAVKFYTKDNFWDDWKEDADIRITAKYGANISDKWPGGGWYVSTSGSEAQSNIDTMPLDGKNFYGQQSGWWTYKAYYYTEVLPGQTGDTTVGSHTYKLHHTDKIQADLGLTVTDADRYPITGFTCNTAVSTQNGQSYNNAKFYYTRNIYNIVFISGGKTVNTESVKYQASIAGYANYKLNTAPAGMEGYAFAGWYASQECTGDAYDFTGKTMPANNITLYAKWKAPTYTVKVYDQNDNLLDTIPVSKGDTVTDELSKLEAQLKIKLAPGDSFLGWTINRSLRFNPGTKITTNYELYAKVGNSTGYSVTYNANGGTGSMTDNEKYAKGAKATVKSNSFRNGDMVFLGWNTKADGTGTTYYPNSTVEITDNVTLYARWGDKASTVSVTYHSNFAPDQTKTVKDIANNSQIKVADYTTLGLPARTGYTFTGWNTQADGTGDSFDADAWVRVNNDGSNVLYAQWVRQTGTLTINKTITGLDTAKDISFTVTGPNSYNQSITIPAKSFTKAANGNFTGSVLVNNLPVGEYTVTENSATVDGYTLNTTTNPTNGKVTVTKEGTTVSFINTYVKHTTAKITITKNVNVTGNTQPTTMPTFQFVAKVDGTKVGELSLTPTKGTDGKWTASGVMDITIPATLFVKDTVDVKISEVDGKLNYWTYDKNVKSLQIAKNGTIHNPVIVKSAAEVVPTDPIASFTFTNEYKYTYTPPARPSDPIRRQPTTTTTTKPVQSVKTGDMGIALYAVTSLLSLSGTALLIKKRKDEK